MRTRSKSVILLLFGLYVLAWTLYPFGGLMAVHPITWLELLVAMLCLTKAGVELIAPCDNGNEQNLQIRLVSTFVFLYLGSAFALLFLGGLSGFWVLSESDASFRYLLVVAGVGLLLIPPAVIFVFHCHRDVV
ncbi:MAG: hypothetical protein QOK37_4605 [Thermoanaerobaculia bacterium]|jgi:hypothetical protein|nr:hypothetical protein [Thermoanaerobaculia bacterium]